MPRLLPLLASTMLLACRPAPGPNYGGTAVEPQLAHTQPDWVDGRASRYPAERYLTAVGRGPERLPCENDARAALAKIFEARIQQVSTDCEQHFSRANEAGRVAVEGMSVSQLTRVSTDHVLKGAHIAELWQGEGAFHCLAVIERLAASRTLRDEVDRLDVQIAASVNEGDQGPNATARFISYKRAMELLQQREALNAELRIVDAAGRGKKPPYDWAALVGKFSGAQARIKIGLRLNGRAAEKMQTCLVEQLSQRGIRVLEETSDIDLMVHGGLKWNWAGQLMGSYMVQIDINLRLSDVEGGRTLAAFAETLKTGRPQREMALQTASNKLCFKVAPKLAQKIETALSGK